MSRQAKLVAVPGWVAPACLAMAVLLTFGRAVTFDFVTLDDWNNVFENPFINPPSLGGVTALWQQGYEALFIPVTYTFWAFWVALFRPPDTAAAPGVLTGHGFHAVNLALHLGCCWLVYGLIRRVLTQLAPAEARWLDRAALVGALLFAVHPVQVEPVIWVTGAKDLLSSLLVLFALHRTLDFAARSSERVPARPGASPAEKPRGRAARRADAPARTFLTPRTAHFLLATAAYALALLTKPSAVAAPLLAFACTTFVARVPPKASARLWAGWALLALPIVFCNKALQSDDDCGYIPTLLERPRVALDALGFYLVHLAAPSSLSIDYGRTPELVLRESFPVFACAGLAAVVAALFLVRTRPVARVAALLFLLPIAPVLGLVPFGFQQYSTVTDRYLYLAMLGPALLLARLLTMRASVRLAGVLGVALVLLSARSASQVGAWRDSFTLFERSLDVTPGSAWLKNSLAHALMQANRDAEALEPLRDAMRLRPGYTDARANYGLVHAKQGRLEEAVAIFREALSESPNRADVHQNLGMALARLGKTEEGKTHLRTVLKIKPDQAGVHDELGIIAARAGNLQEAAREFAECLRRQPWNELARAHLGKALRQLQERGEVPR